MLVQQLRGAWAVVERCFLQRFRLGGATCRLNFRDSRSCGHTPPISSQYCALRIGREDPDGEIAGSEERGVLANLVHARREERHVCKYSERGEERCKEVRPVEVR